MQPSSDNQAPRSFLALLFHPGFASDKVTPREVIEARGAVTLFLAIFALATYWVLPAGGEALLLIHVGSLMSCLLFLVWLVCDVEINWRLKRRGNLLALLEGGANVHVQDRRGATALHMAASRNYPERVKVLLEAGADPNCHDAQGGTPLHWAAESNRVENAKLLRQYGADLDARDIDGTPPIEVAKRKNRQRVLGYLRQWKKEIEQREMVRLAAMDQAIDLPPNYPKAPRSIEWKAAAALLTRGELKAKGIVWSSLDNTAQIHRFAADRHLAEWILAQVPSIALSVYKRVLPPLTDKEGRLEDWELEMQDWRLRPMPPDEPRLPARVTGFTAHPWGRVGLYLVLFDSPDLSPAWGFWYLRQPSARVGTGFPFFRLGDFDDAQLLFWLVLKPFLQKQGIILPGLTPPDEEVYAGPWHEVRDILRFKEMPEWFATVLGKGEE